MKKSKILTIISALLSISSIAHADYGTVVDWSTNDVNTSIKCQINDITVLAKSEVDCNKAGGEIKATDKK